MTVVVSLGMTLPTSPVSISLLYLRVSAATSVSRAGRKMLARSVLATTPKPTKMPTLRIP